MISAANMHAGTLQKLPWNRAALPLSISYFQWLIRLLNLSEINRENGSKIKSELGDWVRFFCFVLFCFVFYWLWESIPAEASALELCRNLREIEQGLHYRMNVFAKLPRVEWVVKTASENGSTPSELRPALGFSNPNWGSATRADSTTPNGVLRRRRKRKRATFSIA